MTDGLRQNVQVRTIYADGERPAVAPVAAREPGRARIVLCAVLFGAVFSVLAVRLSFVSFGMDATFQAIRTETERVVRREVVDREGRPLAMNKGATGLAMNGRDVWDVEEAVTGLKGVFPLVDEARLRARLENGQYTMVVDSVTPQERQRAMALGLPGLRFPETTGRAYPQKDLAAHVVGYTIPGRGGATGLEKALDTEMVFRGEGPLRLSLDLVAQQVLEDELAHAMAVFSAKAAWGVLIHAKTGEVRALASLPDFNPNRPGVAADGAWRNRVMSDVYELGSAFKALTAAKALDTGVTSVGDVFDVSAPVKVGDWEIDDYSRKGARLTMSEVVQYSSNIGTVKMVQRLGTEGFVEALTDLRLDAALRTELPEARAPMVSSTWRPSELASSSYGHGIAITPLQMAAAFTAVVNGGSYVQPTFLADHPAEAERVFAPSTSAQMRIVLRKAVTEGTGRNADAPGYYVIGKTATADKPVDGGYEEKGALISSFVGAFPGYDPEYVLLVSVDEPKGTEETYGFATAGYVAAPIFRRVVARAAPALGVMPVGDEVAHNGFVGLRRPAGGTDLPMSDHDALAALLQETAF